MLTLYGITIVLFGTLGMALVVAGQRLNVRWARACGYSFLVLSAASGLTLLIAIWLIFVLASIFAGISWN